MLAADNFQRAPVQARALEIMVRESLEGRRITAADLAEKVYGRSDETYIKAIRQIARELRYKLPRYYANHGPFDIRLHLPESGYLVEFHSASPIPRVTPAATASAPTVSPDVQGKAVSALPGEAPSSVGVPADPTPRGEAAGSAIAAPAIPDTDASSTPTHAAPAAGDVPSCRPTPAVPDAASAAESGVSATAGARAVSTTGKSARRVRPRALAIVGVALLALFTVAAAALIVRDPEASLPRSVRQTENGIEILNAKGETMPRWDEIISRHIGFKPVPTTGVNMPEQIQAVVLPAEGGKPAALAIAACQPRDASSCSINLLDPSTGAPLASLKAPVLSDGRPVPLRTTGFTGSYPPNHFRIMALQAAELDGNPSGKELLVVLYHSAEYPSQVLYLRNSHSSASGNGGLEILLNYWSFGWIEPQIVPDSDGDGADEVFLYGTYNGENAAIVTLLPPATGSATVLGRSPDGRRPLKIEAAEDHPVRGFSVLFPKTELAHPQVSEQWSVRSEAVSLLLDRAAGIMTVGVADAAHGETSVRLNLAFTLKMNPGEVRVDFLNYDLYMLYLRRAIGSGRLEDRWGIMKSETLDAYGSDLAGRLLCWDDRDPSPRWKPLDLSRLRERLLARAPIRP